MHSPLVNLTATLLLLQALSGWCWQRPEGCKPTATSPSVAVSCCGDSCRHCPLSNESQEPCDCKLECHGVCAYTLPEQVPSEGLSKAWVSVAAIVDVGFVSSVQTKVVAWQRDSWGPISSGPTRLHLLHQVILI